MDICVGRMTDGTWHMRGSIEEIVITPEPATIGLLLLGALLCVLRWCRRNNVKFGENTATRRMIQRSCVPFLMIAVAIAVAGQAASAEPILYGLGFSPYVNGQGPGTVVTAAQTEQRLSIVAEYPRYIRGWGSRNGLEYIPDVAAGYGIGVAQVAYLDLNATDNEAEKANLVAAAVRGNVRWAVVGTEALVNNKVIEGQLIAHLDDVRERLDQAGLSHIPVATAEPYGTWANAQVGGLFHRDQNEDLVHAEVFRHIDLLFAHLYPFHEGTQVETAAQKLSAMYAEVAAAVNEVVPGLPILIGETGWPSAGGELGCCALPGQRKAVLPGRHEMGAFHGRTGLLVRELRRKLEARRVRRRREALGPALRKRRAQVRRPRARFSVPAGGRTACCCRSATAQARAEPQATWGLAD